MNDANFTKFRKPLDIVQLVCYTKLIKRDVVADIQSVVLDLR